MLISFYKEGYTTTFEGEDIIFTPVDIFGEISIIRMKKREYIGSIFEKNKDIIF